MEGEVFKVLFEGKNCDVGTKLCSASEMSEISVFFAHIDCHIF